MKRILLSFLASGVILPGVANAESAWLVLYSPGSVEKIEMKDLSQCEKQGRKWKKTIKIPGVATESFVWACFEGK